MLLSEIENMVRQDLFDPIGPNQRWLNSDLDRAIDKAVDRYSQYYPNIAYTDMATQPFQRTYPYPTSWNPSYPVWWIERIIYPLQVYGSCFAAPSAETTLAIGAGTSLGIGTYRYAITFLSQGGETTLSPLTSLTTTSGNQQISLSNIPPGAASTQGATNTILGRNIYRSLVNGSTLYLLATLPDNTTQNFTDTIADSALSGQPQPPALNSSGSMLWPPRERNFSEYSNIFDTAASLTGGGNLGKMGTVGSAVGLTGTQEPTFTLLLNNHELPADTSQIMRVFYATKHQLDATGSTIPELHRDIIVIGACAYAMEAYQIPTNDNFDFQDGSIHDRLDDTRIPTAWMQAIRQRMQQFNKRLEEIRRQRDYTAGARTQWGEIPRYWHRV